MKNLLLFLIISASVISCKKDKLQNCMIGEWYRTEAGKTTKLTISDNEFIYLFSNGGTTTTNYTIKKNNILSFNLNPVVFCLKINCNSDSLIIKEVNCDNGADLTTSIEQIYYKH